MNRCVDIKLEDFIRRVRDKILIPFSFDTKDRFC